jgi:hypothetical protein
MTRFNILVSLVIFGTANSGMSQELHRMSDNEVAAYNEQARSASKEIQRVRSVLLAKVSDKVGKPSDIGKVKGGGGYNGDDGGHYFLQKLYMTNSTCTIQVFIYDYKSGFDTKQTQISCEDKDGKEIVKADAN